MEETEVPEKTPMNFSVDLLLHQGIIVKRIRSENSIYDVRECLIMEVINVKIKRLSDLFYLFSSNLTTGEIADIEEKTFSDLYNLSIL